METIEQADQIWEVLTEDEAAERGIDYCYWKDVDSEGDWVVTDDGYVMKVRKIYQTKTGNRQIILPGGRSWDGKYSEINYEEYKEVGNFLYNRPQTHGEKEARKGRAKRAIDFYARQVLNGVPHSKMPWDIIGQLYRPDQERPDWSAMRLFKSKEIMAETNKRIMEILDEEGLSDQELTRSFKELLDEAKSDGDLTNWRLTLDSLTKMRGIDKPKEKQRLLEESTTWTREIGEGIAKEKQQIEASRKRQFEEDEDE